MNLKKIIKAIFSGYDLLYTIIGTVILFFLLPETISIGLGFTILFIFQIICTFIGMNLILEYVKKMGLVDAITGFSVSDSIDHVLNLMEITAGLLTGGFIFGYIFLFFSSIPRSIYLAYFFISFYGFTALMGATNFIRKVERTVVENL